MAKKFKKPDDRYLIDYLTKQTGGSIRHKNIRAVDVNSALFDLNRDWEMYHEQEMKRRK
jgi:hypothetical protein